MEKAIIIIDMPDNCTKCTFIHRDYCSSVENQKIILLALSKLLTPHCKGSLNDINGETQYNIDLIERYHITDKILKEINS